MSLYEFKEQDAYDFARFIGIPARPKGNNLQFAVCPYCRSQKDKETFAISLKTGQYKCLRSSCGVKGNMITLSKDFDFSLGNIADEYYKPKKRFKTWKTPKEPIKPEENAISYLESRGISRKTAEKYEVTSHKKRKDIIVFPFFDEKGKLQFIKYRDSKHFKGKTYVGKDGKKRNSPKEWSIENCKPILFGMKQCVDFTTLTVTEGQLDSLSVAEAGIKNAVSVPNGAEGFTWIPYCWNWMCQFKEIVVFGDFEKGHITLLDELSKRFKITVKHVREEDYKDCKDANEILQKYGTEQVRECVENAVTIPVSHVINLADVKPVDIFKIPKLKTGIRQVDRLLYGGLPLGGITLISGKTGEGKSVLASQILINAIHQGYKVFAYSGELTNWNFRSIMDSQIAGRKHIFEFQNEWGDKNYKVSDTNKAIIKEWYDGKCFLYDNSIIGDDDEDESIIKIAESVVMQYGAQVVLLDNLMTAIDLETTYGSDRYERQSVFVKKLARLALRHNILILLVAHKRKNNFSANENDEIMGASDISNLATVTISYDSSDKIEKDQRLLKISKNRLFGKTETSGFIMNYDEKSRRIFGQGDNTDFDYGWDSTEVEENKANDGNGTGEWQSTDEINEELPFD